MACYVCRFIHWRWIVKSCADSDVFGLLSPVKLKITKRMKTFSETAGFMKIKKGYSTKNWYSKIITDLKDVN